MTTYTVPFAITGEVKIEAQTPLEANLKFMQMDIKDLAEKGDLEQLTDPLTDSARVQQETTINEDA